MTGVQHSLRDCQTEDLYLMSALHKQSRQWQSFHCSGRRKAERTWMPFRSGGKTWGIPEILTVGSYFGLLWNLQTLLFSWPATCSGLWNQIICSQSEMYRLEYRNTFGRVKLGVNSWNKGELWCFLIAEDASVGIATRNILCLKNTDVWVLELTWKEQNLIISSLVLFPDWWE